MITHIYKEAMSPSITTKTKKPKKGVEGHGLQRLEASDRNAHHRTPPSGGAGPHQRQERCTRTVRPCWSGPLQLNHDTPTPPFCLFFCVLVYGQQATVRASLLGIRVEKQSKSHAPRGATDHQDRGRGTNSSGEVGVLRHLSQPNPPALPLRACLHRSLLWHRLSRRRRADKAVGRGGGRQQDVDVVR